jgi:hypothetical protein
MSRNRWRVAVSTGLLAMMTSVSLLASAATVEVAGVKFKDTATVANTELKLNGAGIRYKVIFKVYAAGLYLAEKKSTVPEVIALAGPKLVKMVMLRDLTNEDFGRGFMTGIQQNTERSEKLKMVNQFVRFGEMFASVPELKKGDIMLCEWVPGVGTVVSLNGKVMGEPYPDVAFYNALLRIWLGEKPVDSSLKKLMLGESSDDARSNSR